MAYDRTIPVADDPARAERLTLWARRKPRVALMGEFSAGKSTLLNFLIEEDLLPTRATATEVPPVWFSHGDAENHWIDEQGARHVLGGDGLTGVPMTARYVRIYSKAEILEHCDIVDTPGISDPNLAAESWRFAAGIANLVLWCTTATQAWRETERSAWLSLPERLRRHSLVVVTRADKLVTETDRAKVQRRLARETAGLFCDTVFMATPDAVRAKALLAQGEEAPRWESSGAAALLDRLAERFEAIYEERGALLRRHLTGEEEPAAAEATPEPEVEAAPSGPRPVRVQVGSPRRTERPRAEEAEALVARLRVEEFEAAVDAEPAAKPDTDGPLILRSPLPPDAAEMEAGAVFAATDDDKDIAAARDALGLDESAPQSRPGYTMWFGAREARAAEAAAAEAAEAEADPETAVAEAAEHPAEPQAADPSAALMAALALEDFPASVEDDDAGAAVAEVENETVLAADEENAGFMPEAASDSEADMEDDPALLAALGALVAPGSEPAPVQEVASEIAEAVVAGLPEVEADSWTAGPVADAEPMDPAMDAPVAAPETDAEHDPALLITPASESEAQPEIAQGVQVEDLPEVGADDAAAASAADAGTVDTFSAQAEADAEPALVLEVEPEDDAYYPVPQAGPIAEPAAVAPVQPAAPAAVLAWRAIVARTALEPGNAQIAAMIEELLAILQPQDLAPPGVAEPAPEADTPEADGALGGWRRLA